MPTTTPVSTFQKPPSVGGFSLRRAGSLLPHQASWSRYWLLLLRQNAQQKRYKGRVVGFVSYGFSPSWQSSWHGRELFSSLHFGGVRRHNPASGLRLGYTLKDPCLVIHLCLYASVPKGPLAFHDSATSWVQSTQAREFWETFLTLTQFSSSLKQTLPLRVPLCESISRAVDDSQFLS